ncbi:hypothetical protein C8J57DRAFT_1458610 [Mycena rebaudengoi]|nr:hypothetical protein C8J57DRAFT_1458610 [Mycena rebaudengoi]
MYQPDCVQLVTTWTTVGGVFIYNPDEHKYCTCAIARPGLAWMMSSGYFRALNGGHRSSQAAIDSEFSLTMTLMEDKIILRELILTSQRKLKQLVGNDYDYLTGSRPRCADTPNLESHEDRLPPVAATATAVDLTGDLRPRAVSRRPVESLKKFLTGRHGQRDGRDGSTGPWDLRNTHNIANTFLLTETDMAQMMREKGRVRSERTETEAIKEV